VYQITTDNPNIKLKQLVETFVSVPKGSIPYLPTTGSTTATLREEINNERTVTLIKQELKDFLIRHGFKNVNIQHNIVGSLLELRLDLNYEDSVLTSKYTINE
jgi:hypothetical protein